MATNQIVLRGQTRSGTAGAPVVNGIRTNLFKIEFSEKLERSEKSFEQYDGERPCPLQFDKFNAKEQHQVCKCHILFLAVCRGFERALRFTVRRENWLIKGTASW